MHKLGTVDGVKQRDWVAEIDEIYELLEAQREEIQILRGKVGSLHQRLSVVENEVLDPED